MSGRYVITNDKDGMEIPAGTRHFEVQIKEVDKNKNELWGPSLHFLQWSEAVAYLAISLNSRNIKEVRIMRQ